MDRMQVLKNDRKFTILRLVFHKIKGTHNICILEKVSSRYFRNALVLESNATLVACIV